MPSLFDSEVRARVVARLDRLTPSSERRWGRMTAPEMVAHLTDQMGHTLGDVPVEAHGGPLSWAPIRYLSIYVVPWPRGKVRGPAEAFVSRPGEWNADLERLRSLVERFGSRDPRGDWPDHLLFGRMSGRDWGYFCHKHFDHHLRQFGV